jgi:hypothetical protein
MNDLLFDKKYCDALCLMSDLQKEEEYEQIKSSGFDSEEIWEMWYESDEDIDSFIEMLEAETVRSEIIADDREAN